MNSASSIQQVTMNRTQTARYIGVSLRKLDDMIQKGQGPPSILLLGRRLFRPESVNRWLETLERGAS